MLMITKLSIALGSVEVFWVRSGATNRGGRTQDHPDRQTTSLFPCWGQGEAKGKGAPGKEEITGVSTVSRHAIDGWSCARAVG